VARAARRGLQPYGPRWLQQRLAQLLPGFPDSPLCVAFSGGADSTALLAALARLPRPPLTLRALHVDHRLHPRSGRWGAHCRRIARALGVPLAVRTADIARRRGESPEAAARAARYALLGASLAAGEVLLTAHSEEDQLETVLLQLLRGSGVAGLAAMPEVMPFARGWLARPLLPRSRAELRAWVSAQRLAWIEDESNASLTLDRNFLRLQVLPVLHQRWPQAATTVSRTARHAAEAQRLLDELGEADVARAACGAALSARALRALPPDRRRNALRYWISAAGRRPPPSRRLEEIAGPLLEARADARPRVAWEGAVVERHAELLTLAEPQVAAAEAGSGLETAWHWRESPTCTLPASFGRLALRHEARGPLDLEALEALGPTLTVRARRGGERLRPGRGGRRRTLKNLLQEMRVPPGERSRLPLIFAGGRLIAVAGIWLDESVQARAASTQRARFLWGESG